MEKIVRYIPGDNGKYTAVVEGLTLGKDETLMLDNGVPVNVDVSVHDPFKISDKQRKKIFALLNDIESHTGQPREYMRSMFQDYLRVMNGLEDPISLATCTKKVASELIEVILHWVFLHDIPLSYKTSDLMKEDNYFIYLSTISRTCVICGSKNADLAHRHAVGSGRNRNEINHIGNEVLALCRRHHSEQHEMGINSFNQKYHLTNSWVKVDAKLNAMLKGR